MANVTLKAPAGVAAGSIYLARDGTSYTVGAGGLLTIPVLDAIDAQRQGYIYPGTFGAATSGLVALAGGGQANATALQYGLNQLATVVTANDSAALPPAVPGEAVTVVNDGAKQAAIFSTVAAGDTINGVAGATGIVQAPNTTVTYSCAVAGQWRAVPGTGYGSQGGVPAFGPAANGIASNGTTQGNGTPLTARINRITTTGSVNGACTLPAALPGDQRIVTNVGANSANIFPAVNEAITNGAANAAFNLAANKTAQFSCAVAGQWDAILTA